METSKHEQDLFKAMSPFQGLMPLVIAVSALSIVEKLHLAFLETEVEKALGRPLTEYDRRLCRGEYERKQAWEKLMSRSKIYARLQRDEEVIRRIVWGNQLSS